MTTTDLHTKNLLDLTFERLGRLREDWEERPGQLEMAHLWAETLEQGGVLAVEAPTGIGKSLAYLLPAMLRRIRGSGPVLVSTCTKALQEQLLRQDVPLALHALGKPLRVTTLKGRQNYLCRRRAEARLAQRRLFSDAGLDDEAFERLATWVERTTTGELDELSQLGLEIPLPLLLDLASDPLVCASAGCDAATGCFAKRARREAQRADVVLVNHALLLSDPGLRAGLIAEADSLILDEAHQLERVARDQLGVTVGMHDLLRLAGRTDGRTGVLRLLKRAIRKGRGGAVLERIQRVEESLPRVLAHAKDFARDLERLLPAGAATARIARDLDLSRVSPTALDQLLASLGSLSRDLETLAETAEENGLAALRQEGAEALDEVRARAAAWTEIARALRAVVGVEEKGSAFYLDRDDRGTPRLNRRPVRVGAALRQTLFGLCDRVLLTSATLRAGSDFGPMIDGLGLSGDEVRSAALPSPFQLARQVFCAAWDGPEPNDPGFPARLSDLVVELATGLRKNTLVLLTSYQMLDSIAAQCAPRLEAAGIRLLRQIPGEAAALLADEFRAGGATVLLGTASFWEGVDFPGAALEVLLIARLPFSVPTDPVYEARAELISAEGGDPFRELALPEAVLRFRQGMGRLIRTAEDRGALIVADPRLSRASYGRLFASTLPNKPFVSASISELAAEAGRWFSREAAPCPA